jgi:tetratricopeptide (TPR) repeat protein
MKKIILILLSSIFISIAHAQDNSMQQAFASSYSLEKAGNYAGAAHAITNVYNPKSYECNLRLGYLKYMLGAYAESGGYYQKSIELMPYAIEPKLGKVLPLAALGKWDDVLAMYVSILKIDPKNSSVNYKLGYIYYTRKQYTLAYKCFEKSVNLYPFDYDALLMFAWTNYRLGRLKEAKLLFHKVLLASPADKSALEGLSLIK